VSLFGSLGLLMRRMGVLEPFLLHRLLHLRRQVLDLLDVLLRLGQHLVGVPVESAE